MIPSEITHVFETREEDDFDLAIDQVTFDASGFNFILSLRTYNSPDNNDLRASWRVDVIGHRENRIAFQVASDIHIKSDHPLLWPYNDIQAHLYCIDTCAEPEKLFYAFYHEHEQIFGTYIPYGTFTNMKDFRSFFQLNGGLVAKGPKNLLMRYASLLDQAGMRWSITNEYLPAAKNGIKSYRRLQILLLQHTDIYIIAEDFIFTRLASSTISS